ncbi:hypothetical protein, partial [Burkholderia vietnamiensis]|uniref:hypothetical protein n=1 Tax=Burkholderia vietnamiensis TaxID=60552 RepID=UPI001ABA6B5A
MFEAIRGEGYAGSYGRVSAFVRRWHEEQGVGRKVIMSHFARSKSKPPFSTVSLLRAKAGDAPEGTVDAN